MYFLEKFTEPLLRSSRSPNEKYILFKIVLFKKYIYTKCTKDVTQIDIINLLFLYVIVTNLCFNK